MSVDKWEDMYDNLAKEHGATARASLYMNEKSFYLHQKRTLDWIGPVKSKKILDVGCGTGLFILPLVRDNEVTGLDVSKEALNLAKEQGLHCCIHSTVLEAPLEDQQFDLVLCIGTLQCMQEPGIVVEKLKRLVKPGGMLVIETLNARSALRWFLEKTLGKKNYEQTICPRWLDQAVTGCGNFKLEGRLNFFLPFNLINTSSQVSLVKELAIGTFAMKWRRTQ